MKTFEFLEHKADVRFRAYGKSLEEAFANCIRVFTELIEAEAKTSKASKARRAISVSGRDIRALLYCFLEEVLFLIDSEGFLPEKAEGLTITYLDEVKGKGNTSYALKAELIGKTAVIRSNPIKAVTYNQMEIHEGNPYYVEVVMDT
ncbi:hypothetical protein AUJ69_02290 [Candidatus Woesearchaeota archaeon CG1_02_47_18]|nr:MAG: hypothetical protein AUJ69_02290 [Candidatus Woesearchaeota archaeon CG1_02_47_18]